MEDSPGGTNTYHRKVFPLSSPLNGLNVACIYSNLSKLSLDSDFIVFSTKSSIAWGHLNKVVNLQTTYETFLIPLLLET
jgi:hypothetical protein